jgi:ABC-type transporter Mla subunit MlaD
MVGAVVPGALPAVGRMLMRFGANQMSPFTPATIQVRPVTDDRFDPASGWRPRDAPGLKASLKNTRTASEKADRIGGNLETLRGIAKDATATVNDVRSTVHTTQGQILDVSKQASDSPERVSRMLDRFQSIADEKINNGRETAGARSTITSYMKVLWTVLARSTGLYWTCSAFWSNGNRKASPFG